MDFKEADRRYAELKQRHENGTVSADDLDIQLKEVMVRDAGGHWWTKGRSTGAWHRRNGNVWMRVDPPREDQGSRVHSRVGVASFVLSVLAGVSLLIFCVLAIAFPAEVFYYSLLLVCLLAGCVALCLGLVGMVQRQRRKLFTVLGTAIVGLTFVFVLLLIAVAQSA